MKLSNHELTVHLVYIQVHLESHVLEPIADEVVEYLPRLLIKLVAEQRQLSQGVVSLEGLAQLHQCYINLVTLQCEHLEARIGAQSLIRC